MGEINYAPLIDDMVWSYSRIKAFVDCPYRFYLKYIRHIHGKEMFFASYGTFMHKLIETYFKEGKSPRQLTDIYLRDFKKEVVGRAPNKTVFGNYFTGGLEYLRGIHPFPYRPAAIEKKVDFKVNGIPFIGYIDFLGELDGSLYVVDNKSRVLKPRSKREKPTKTDEELDAYLRQLYLYSAAVEEEYGVRPHKLCFNCFRTDTFIEEPFLDRDYEGAKQWLAEMISEIRQESDFKPSCEFFKCTHLCEISLDGHVLVLAPHAGCIDADTWIRCRRKCLNVRQIAKPVKAKNTWLAGKIKCIDCGHALSLKSYPRKRSADARYYICNSKYVSASCDGVGAIQAAGIEDIVFDEMSRKLKEFNKLSYKEKHGDPIELTKLKIRAEEIEKEIATLIDKIVSASTATMEYINERIDALDEEKKTVKEKIAQMSAEMYDRQNIGVISDYMSKWNDISIDDKLTVVDTLIESIHVGHGKIKIAWKI